MLNQVWLVKHGINLAGENQIFVTCKCKVQDGLETEWILQGHSRKSSKLFLASKGALFLGQSIFLFTCLSAYPHLSHWIEAFKSLLRPKCFRGFAVVVERTGWPPVSPGLREGGDFDLTPEYKALSFPSSDTPWQYFQLPLSRRSPHSHAMEEPWPLSGYFTCPSRCPKWPIPMVTALRDRGVVFHSDTWISLCSAIDSGVDWYWYNISLYFDTEK